MPTFAVRSRHRDHDPDERRARLLHRHPLHPSGAHALYAGADGRHAASGELLPHAAEAGAGQPAAERILARRSSRSSSRRRIRAFPSGHATEAFMSADVLVEAVAGGIRAGNKPYTIRNGPSSSCAWPPHRGQPHHRRRALPGRQRCRRRIGLTLGSYFVARCQDPGMGPAVTMPIIRRHRCSRRLRSPLADGDFYWTLYYNTAWRHSSRQGLM